MKQILKVDTLQHNMTGSLYWIAKVVLMIDTLTINTKEDKLLLFRYEYAR